TFDPAAVSYITDLDVVRAAHPPMQKRAADKVLARLDEHCRAILALCPFCVIATSGGRTGGLDVSPRGDPPGFIRVLDATHVLLPDRIGNNRFDNYANLMEDPRVALLALIPGMAETLRINGRARITDDDALLADSAVQGRPPKFGLLITVEEAFLHCAKAVNRGKLWEPGAQIDRTAALPSYSQMLADHVDGLTLDQSLAMDAEMKKRGLY
ncbi:MAG: MSMEG_1061 family FMN-dependent PPOX-type flavoprotein, partial [Pseudomonadota bacterium]